MLEKSPKMTIHDRVTAVLAGEKPDRIPFVDRMELWYQSKTQEGALPDEYRGMSLNEVHEAVGMGRQKFTVPTIRNTLKFFTPRLKKWEAIRRGICWRCSVSWQSRGWMYVNPFRRPH